ncbi:AAA family ATPase [Sulfuricurvum sp. IAE1]|uniref:ATP-binding protein n=1 Tax=Sulfuricurvum sp. IAE1 TaxID=2546102 RepID=UPI00104362E8|nr:ATP-binding protein [Sulfuricurvum sp. IAE1]MDX9965833.1 ATP-binding protein [Sulfuricurvum sp.]TDA62740.1 AAA family ATPase [Sulfuricurvum sp. IAE1]
MKYLIDFLENPVIEQSHIFQHLKCSADEAKILRLLTRKFLQGQEDVVVAELLQEIYGAQDYSFLSRFGEVKTLMELGWLTHHSFTPIKISELSQLELYNTPVALTPVFMKLIEEGSLEMTLPDIKPYADHLEYLQDQFFRIELYQKMSIIRHNGNEHSLGINRIQKKLELLEKRIEERIAQTSHDVVLDRFFKNKKLEPKEQVIFLALLKEEYSATEGNLREMNTLIDLISFDDYERIKNRALLEDGARLINEDVIDYEEMLNPFGGISRAFYIVDEVLQSIMHPQKKKKVRKLKLDMLIKEQDIFELIEPSTSLENVVLNPTTEQTLQNLMRQLDREVVSRLHEWGIKDKKAGIDARIIFYGPPGTGKTLTAHSLAKSLKRQVLSFDCSKILSMYVGESEKNVRKIFDTYADLTRQTKTEPILLLNEADQFLSSRSSGVGSSADQMHNQMQNIFLEQIEKFQGILIATTNLLENIDQAFSRRFNYKIEFKKPDQKQRLALWKMMLPQNAPYEEGFDVEALVSYPLTGGQINLIVKNTAYHVAARKEGIFRLEDFVAEIKKERSGSFEGEKSMGFINR